MTASLSGSSGASLPDPQTRSPDTIQPAQVRYGDVVRLDDGRVAVFLERSAKSELNVSLEASPGAFSKATESIGPAHLAQVLYRIRVRDYVVSQALGIGVVVSTPAKRGESYLVRHLVDGHLQPNGSRYLPGELVLASPEDSAAWLRSIPATEPAAARTAPQVTAKVLLQMLQKDFPLPSIPPDQAQAGDVIRLRNNSIWMLSGPPNELVAYPMPGSPDKPIAGKFQVEAVLHRLAEGDYVTVAGNYNPRLGRVESVRMGEVHNYVSLVRGAMLAVARQAAPSSVPAGLEYLVRTRSRGKGWAEHSTAWKAADLWPLPADWVAALLEAKGIPPPPALPNPSRPRPPGSQLAAVGAAYPGIPAPPPAVAAPEPPASPPVPPGEFAELFATVAYPGPLRRYQAMAVDAFEKARASGRRRAYLVLPPGAGKTLVGLEIARRLGNPTIALGPNTAIQEQWVKQWRQYQPGLVEASDSADLEAPITALNYQSICNLDSHNPALDEQVAELQGEVDGQHPAGDANPHHQADAARLRGHARRLIAEAGDHAKLMEILHPNGRRLIERIKAAGQFTIILDECHHLLEMWGYLLRALVDELGDGVFLVGLTATPPSEMDAREAVLYQELFGSADFEVPTPAVVKEGNLAPYQELAYLTTPLEHETAYIAEEKTRFEELVTEMTRPDLGTVSFLDWLRTRIFDRQTKEGVPVAWPRFESDHPELALAALRYCFANQLPPPEGARLGEAHRRPPDANDWVVLIGDYCTGHLRESADPKDLEAWEMIRRALPSLGYVLTRQGVHSYVSPVDRVLLLSASKGVAAIEILTAEQRALGQNLRALLLCDYEVAGSELVGKLRGVLDAQAGSAALLLKTLLSDAGTASLDPILVTGKTVACSRATGTALIPWLGEQAGDLKDRLSTAGLFQSGADGWDDVVEVAPSPGAWSAAEYLPMITSYFEEGRSHCLIGTRGLLGEGWDAKSINVLIDLTGVTTTTSVHQMRGRSLRLDPKLPHKVADNWDVVCVARDHPKGTADYDRFVRKHRNYFAITSAGEIESGVGHVDQRLSPFGPPAVEVASTVNLDVLQRSEGRDHIYDLWGIGRPYQNLPTETVRIRSTRPLGLPAQHLLAGRPGVPAPPLLKARAVGGVVAGGAALAFGLATGQDLLGFGAGVLLAAGGTGWAASSILSYANRLGPSSALEDLAAAVADGLAGAGLMDGRLGAAAIRIVTQPDGYYRCYLEGASLSDSTLFATALDELLAPLQSPRYIIPRYVSGPPAGWVEGLRLLARQFGNPRLGAAVVYHAVPSALAANKSRVQAFQVAWNAHVSAGEALFEDDPRAQAVIQLQRGEDPFAVTTQMRTLWE
jgi:superfamily II DNA or RNA helicase